MLVVLCLAASAAMTRPAVQLSRRAAVLSAISLPACALADDDAAARAPEITTAAQRTLGALNAGSRKLSDENVAEGDLMAELLRRTEANKERNAAIVKATTESNAFTAIDGSVEKRLVTGLDGRNRYLDANQIRELTLQRRLACAPSLMEACREVKPVYDAAPLQIPEPKRMVCEDSGRDCKFQ